MPLQSSSNYKFIHLYKRSKCYLSSFRVRMHFYYKIPDIWSPHIVGFFLSFLRSFEHTNKNLLLSPQIFLLNIHDLEIRLAQTVAITIKSELHINTYIYKRLKCYLFVFLLVLMHFSYTTWR
jgi:hypothetical protein